MTDIDRIIANVNAWQSCGHVHPLTCNDDKCRADLRAEERDGKVVLVCPSCGLVQEWIPGVCAAGPPPPPIWQEPRPEAQTRTRGMTADIPPPRKKGPTR